MKILASDFDNTLLFYDGMRENDLKAIKEFQKQGNLFGVCTGRTLEGIERSSKDFDIDYDFYILTTGSLILNKNKDIILQKKIPMKVAKKLRELVCDDIHMSIVCQGKVYHLDKHNTSTYPGIKIKNIEEINAEEIDACGFHYPRGEIQAARVMINKIKDELSNQVSAFQNNEHIDLTSLGCSKGKGIDIIKDYFHLNLKDVYGIGDSFNDLPMFEHVGHSYTFDYSDQEVKEKADHVVTSLAECIDEILKED